MRIYILHWIWSLTLTDGGWYRYCFCHIVIKDKFTLAEFVRQLRVLVGSIAVVSLLWITKLDIMANISMVRQIIGFLSSLLSIDLCIALMLILLP